MFRSDDVISKMTKGKPIDKKSTERKIFDLTRSKLALGAGNMVGAPSGLYQKNIKMRKLSHNMLGLLQLVGGFDEVHKDPFKYLILDQLISAALAEAVQTGFCGEYSGMVFINALRENLTQVECVHFFGFDRRGNPSDHCVVISGRKQPSDINDQRTWGPFTLIDGWAGKPPIKFDTSEDVTTHDICPCLTEVTKIKLEGSYNAKFTPKDWSDFLGPLTFLRTKIEAICKLCSLSITKEEQSKIETIFEKYIDFIKELSQKKESSSEIQDQKKHNIALSFDLEVKDDDSGKPIIFSIVPEKSEKSSPVMKDLQSVLGKDIVKSKGKIEEYEEYKVDASWLKQVNEVNPAGISQLCQDLHFNECFFRKKLNLYKFELLIEGTQDKPLSILLDYNQIEEMKKIALFVGSPIKKIIDGMTISYRTTVQWFGAVHKCNPEGFARICEQLRLDQDKFLEQLGLGITVPAKVGNHAL